MQTLILGAENKCVPLNFSCENEKKNIPKKDLFLI